MIQILNLYLHLPSDKKKYFLTCRFKSEGVIRVISLKGQEKRVSEADVKMWFESKHEMFLRKKVLWHNLKDMDAVRSLLTHTRKINF